MKSFSRAIAVASVAAAATMVSSSAIAAPTLQTVPVTFSGIITDTPLDDDAFEANNGYNLMVRDGTGTMVPYTGPLPDYPYKIGDQISFSFDALVPSAASIAAGDIPLSANGIYEFQIGPRPSQIDSFPGFGSYTNLDISGPITGPASEAGLGTNGGFSIVYDANAGQYYVNPDFRGVGGTDSWGFGFFAVPVPTYDEATGTLGVSWTTPTGGSRGMSGNGDSGRISVGYTSTTPGSGATIVGGGDIRIAGAGWNLPVFGGAPTPVPEPGMLTLFGLAAAALVQRRRRAAKPA